MPAWQQQTHWYYGGSNGQYSYLKNQLWLRWLTCIVLLLAPSCNDHFAHMIGAPKVWLEGFVNVFKVRMQRGQNHKHRDIGMLPYWISISVDPKFRQHQHKVNVSASFCLGSMPVFAYVSLHVHLRVPCALHSAPIHIAAVGVQKR